MRVFSKAPDGGQSSGVTGYFLCEFKGLFSVVLLHFAKGTREAYHDHAFNAVTLWLKGHVLEHRLTGEAFAGRPVTNTTPYRAGHLKWTPRDCFHKVEALRSTWALSFRGPWAETWQELRGEGTVVALTHGRMELGHWPL